MKKAIILSGVPWDTTLQRHHKIAGWLKKMGYEVIFLEAIPSSKITLKKIMQKLKTYHNHKNKIKNERNVEVINAHLFPPSILFNGINCIKIKRILKKIGYNYEIVVNYLPIYTTYYIINHLDYDTLIYDCDRDFSNWGVYPKSVKNYENYMHLKAKYIFTDSFYLTHKHKGIQILPSLSEKQYQVFKLNKRPCRIKSVLYFGQIDSHINLHILNKISKKYQLHLIGNSNLDLNFDYVNHGFFSNKEELAKEIIKCDAIIIPYIGNMDGVIPAKLIEALASNLPVFVNEFFDSRQLEEYCYVYTSEKELFYMLDNYNFNDKTKPEKLIIDNIEDNQYLMFKSILNNEKNVGE